MTTRPAPGGDRRQRPVPLIVNSSEKTVRLNDPAPSLSRAWIVNVQILGSGCANGFLIPEITLLDPPEFKAVPLVV